MFITLEKKIQSFKSTFLEEKKLSSSFTKDSYDYLNEAKRHVAELFKTLSNIEEIEYAGNNLIGHLEAITFFSVIDKLAPRYERLNVLKPTDKQDVFRYQKSLLIEYIAELMGDEGVNMSTEHFTSEEYSELKQMIAGISEKLYEMYQNQHAANEVIYNSVEEIKNELVKSAEKSKIFGKDFVMQQLAGKVIDMAVKGGAGAMLTKMSLNDPQLSEMIKMLL